MDLSGVFCVADSGALQDTFLWNSMRMHTRSVWLSNRHLLKMTKSCSNTRQSHCTTTVFAIALCKSARRAKTKLCAFVKFLCNFMMGFSKGSDVQCFFRPLPCEKQRFWGHWTSSAQGQKHPTKIIFELRKCCFTSNDSGKEILASALGSCRHGMSI